MLTLTDSFFTSSLTTRNNKIWEGLVGNEVNSFLPLGTTPAIPGRASVELLSNTYGIFKGTSLIFLEVERVVPESSLGHPVGEVTPRGLALVRREREMCAKYWREWSRERQVYAGQWKSQPYIPRPPYPINTGRPRAASFFSEQQFERSQFVRGQVEGVQSARPRGHIKDQIEAVGGVTFRRWSV